MRWVRCPGALRVGATRVRVLCVPATAGHRVACCPNSGRREQSPHPSLQEARRGHPRVARVRFPSPPRGVAFPDCLVKAAMHGNKSQRDFECVLRLHDTLAGARPQRLFVQDTVCCSGFLPSRHVTLGAPAASAKGSQSRSKFILPFKNVTSPSHQQERCSRAQRDAAALGRRASVPSLAAGDYIPLFFSLSKWRERHAEQGTRTLTARKDRSREAVVRL